MRHSLISTALLSGVLLASPLGIRCPVRCCPEARWPATHAAQARVSRLT